MKLKPLLILLISAQDCCPECGETQPKEPGDTARSERSPSGRG